jgi:Reverse transcriptase (RNA-dependent DNA polymerase)
VSHSVLLDKLSKYGCPQVVIGWLANFLTHRTQSVASFSGMSSKLAITCRINQGSGIGPTTAFIAMIADLQPLHNSTKFCKYADDLTVVTPGSLTLHGNEEIESLKLWTIHNQLLIKTSKSEEVVL